MKTVFKLCLVTSFRQLTPFLMALIVIVAPLVFPMFTNYLVDPDVIKPARMQAAWQVAWFVGILWLLFFSASNGAYLAKSRIGEYFKSSGCGDGGQMAGLWMTSMVYAIFLALIPTIISLVTVLSGGDGYNGHWWVLSLQHVSLMLLVFSGLNFLSLALGSRFGATVGYVGSLIIAFSGLFLVLALEKVVVANDFFALDLLYTILPHFYLADLTHRFIHQHGAMTSSEYFVVFEYLAGWSLLLSGISCLIFTPEEK